MKVYRYKLLLVACPFPFEVVVVAGNLKAAKAKGKFQGKLCGLKTGKLIEHEIIGIIEL
jgi:hypothetical protein